MNKRQSGFSILEIILIVAVVGLIGAVAWLFVTNQKNGQTDKGTSTKTSESDKKDDRSKNPTGDWHTYSPAAKQYSIKVADGWTLHKKQGGDTSLYSTGELSLKSGTAGKVVDTEGDIGQCDVFVLDYLPYEKNDDMATGTLTTESGLELKTNVTKDELGISGGGLTYSYNATKNSKTVHMTYTTCKDGKDHHETAELVAKTLEIL